MIVAEKKFVIDSSRERVWEFLLKAAMESIPFERMELVDERNFLSLLRVRIGPVALPMYMNMEIVEISEPETLVTALKGRGMGGMVWLNQKVIITLSSIDESKTEVSCKVMAEEMAVVARVFLLWKIKSFSRGSLEGIERLLRQWS